MKFNFSLDIGRSKSKEQAKGYSGDCQNPAITTTAVTSMNDFIPIDFASKASAQALINMYETLPEVQIPVNYIIDKMPIINFKHVKITNDKEEVIKDSDVIKLLQDPNQYQNWSDFLKDFFLNRLVIGAVYVNRIVPLGYDLPSQLYILPSASTEIDLNKVSQKDIRLNNISGYKTDWGYGQVSLTADEITAQYETNLCTKIDEVRSRLMSAIATSDSLRYNYEARVKIYRDRGALGILSPKDAMSAILKTDADALKTQYYRDNGITGSKAPFMITPRAMEYTKVGFSVDELKLNENKLQDFNTICNIFQVDPALFDNTRSTYNNKVLAKKNFWGDVGIPQFNSCLELLGNSCKLPANEKLKADYSDITELQADYETKVNANSKAYIDGAISQAEYREAIGYEGGDTSIEKASPTNKE